MVIKPIKKIRQIIDIPGDKSISHRAIMLSSIAEGESKIFNFLKGDDPMNTIACFRQMGVSIDLNGDCVVVRGVGLRGLVRPADVLDVGNSGTTIRLMAGILAGQDFQSIVSGDESIKNRPMDRIIKPLRKMGANIKGIDRENFAPLKIHGGDIRPIKYNLPVASAQVKSAILLASLYAKDKTIIVEPKKSRDHTERMMNYMGADIWSRDRSITSEPLEKLYGKEIYIPGDISSAAFFLVLGTLVEDGEILINGVGLNPTRTGILDVLRQMGASIQIISPRVLNGEPMGDLLVKSSSLKGISIGGDMIPRLIDEVPIIAVAASLAEGKTTISNAEELKVKESNRISAMVNELKNIGADIEETHDGMIIHGKSEIRGGKIHSYKDHRIAMALTIAGLVSQEGVDIDDPNCVDISFPNFFHIINGVIKDES
ncbi:MAG: 3-phosphoshikimate 1-carboxyvinyltransferase [Tissierellaceae bacterium]